MKKVRLIPKLKPSKGLELVLGIELMRNFSKDKHDLNVQYVAYHSKQVIFPL